MSWVYRHSWLLRSRTSPTRLPAAASDASISCTVRLCRGAEGSAHCERICSLSGVFMGMKRVGATGSPTPW
jgi:hypothetical protein